MCIRDRGLEQGLGMREVLTSSRAVVERENCLEQHFNLAQARPKGIAAKKFDQVGNRALGGLFAGRDKSVKIHLPDEPLMSVDVGLKKFACRPGGALPRRPAPHGRRAPGHPGA